jgi:phytoene dehydrogenase-like protein
MTLPREVDAVVIGAGPNGLVAANRLADAGWETLLLEAQPEVGGAGNALHADIPLDGAGSAFLGLLLIMLGQTIGFPVPEGGAGRLSEAMRDRFIAHGGAVICNAEVTKIIVSHRRVVGVQAHDQLVRVRRAVLADVAAEHLYGRLVTFDELPPRIRVSMARFRRDPGTFKIDYALSAPVPWLTPPPYAPGTLHISDSYEELVTSFAQLSTGNIPERPFLLMGQMTTTDPTRSPDGTESLWAYTHVPQRVLNDAGEKLTGAWDIDEAERFADRMQARIEQVAPGFSQRIIARRILTPIDLERRDASLVGGSLNGGTAALDQQLIFRPIPGLGRSSTPISGLYLASASAHPGGSVHGAGGMNAARAALAHGWLRPRRA